MIALSSVLAGGEAIDRLIHPRDVHHLWAVAGAAVIGFAGNEVVARYRINVGRRIGSAAQVADGLHARADGFTSLAVLLGAGGVVLGWPRTDPITGLVITVAILGVLRSAVRQVGAGSWMPSTPASSTKRATPSAPSTGSTPSANSASAGSVTPCAPKADITVDPTLTVSQAHDLAHHAEDRLLTAIGRLNAVTIHVSPSGAHST